MSADDTARPIRCHRCGCLWFTSANTATKLGWLRVWGIWTCADCNLQWRRDTTALVEAPR